MALPDVLCSVLQRAASSQLAELKAPELAEVRPLQLHGRKIYFNNDVGLRTNKLASTGADNCTMRSAAPLTPMAAEHTGSNCFWATREACLALHSCDMWRQAALTMLHDIDATVLQVHRLHAYISIFQTQTRTEPAGRAQAAHIGSCNVHLAASCRGG